MYILMLHGSLSCVLGAVRMSDELEAFFELAESTITYVHHCYEEGLDEDIKADDLDLRPLQVNH